MAAGGSGGGGDDCHHDAADTITYSQVGQIIKAFCTPFPTCTLEEDVKY